MGTLFRFASVAVLALAAATSFAAPQDFRINEVEPNDDGTDNREYVEIKGTPGDAATSLVLVVYNGRTGTSLPIVKNATDLSSCVADENGFILIGSSALAGVDISKADGWIENDEEAVALFYGRPVSDFPTTANPTSTGLVDVCVYESGADTTAARDWSGFALSPAPTVYAEMGPVSAENDKYVLSRIPDLTGTFQATGGTPNAPNTTEGFAVTSELQFRRQNQFTMATTTATVTIRNTNSRPLAVSTFALDASTSSAFTAIQTADPAPPVTLSFDQTTTMVIQFAEADMTTPKLYYGQINYVTDNPTSGSGIIPIRAEFVPAVTTAAVGDVKVNEIMYVPTQDWNGDGLHTSSQYDEFVELYNTTNAAIDISGWQQRSIDVDAATTDTVDAGNYFVFPAGSSIPAKGFVVVFSGGTPTGFAPGVAYAFYNSARFRNIGAFETVRDGANNVIDAIAYLQAQDTPDVDGFLNVGIAATNDGGSYGRFPDGENLWMAYKPTGILPTPGASNNMTAAKDWMLFE